MTVPEPCMCGDPICVHCGPRMGYPPPCPKCHEVDCDCVVPLDADDVHDLHGVDAWEADDCMNCGMCESCIERSIAAAEEGDAWEAAHAAWRDEE